MRNILTQTICVCATAGMFTFVTGCQTQQSAEPPTPAVPAAMQPARTRGGSSDPGARGKAPQSRLRGPAAAIVR